MRLKLHTIVGSHGCVRSRSIWCGCLKWKWKYAKLVWSRVRRDLGLLKHERLEFSLVQLTQLDVCGAIREAVGEKNGGGFFSRRQLAAVATRLHVRRADRFLRQGPTKRRCLLSSP